MNSLNKDWDDMQVALRSGYVITLRELAIAPGFFCLDPDLSHPLFVRNALPGNFKEDEIKRFLSHMNVEYKLLPAKHPNN
ncbi:MAG: hypothetical protein ACLFT3_18725 [Cyclobacteriaceae bacterium]